jgi:hypothetical protein
VLEALGLLVDLVPGDAEDVGEEALDHPVPAHDRGGVAVALLGELERLVGGLAHVPVGLQPADHLVDGRCGELHGAGDVGARDRQARLLEPEDRLEVLLFGDRRLLARHARTSRWTRPS